MNQLIANVALRAKIPLLLTGFHTVGGHNGDIVTNPAVA
jgi:hypothetical protein